MPSFGQLGIIEWTQFEQLILENGLATLNHCTNQDGFIGSELVQIRAFERHVMHFSTPYGSRDIFWHGLTTLTTRFLGSRNIRSMFKLCQTIFMPSLVLL